LQQIITVAFCRVLTFSITIFSFVAVKSQSFTPFADSIRIAYNIPEIAYAVVSSDKVYEMEIRGIKKANTKRIAEPNDRFRIGSNTKAITGFIAARLVKEKKISWDTRFFDLFPELKAKSNRAYYGLTLLDLLSFRTRLFPYTYTYSEPAEGEFKGNETEQRYQFARWFLRHKPVAGRDSIHFSNLGYIAAGLMMEKTSGKPYKELVDELGAISGIQFGFGAPNSADTLQPWGHDRDMNPEAPGDNYKLNWLLPAGNININLPDYVRFIQMQLQGLSGKSDLLTKEEFNFLHFGLAKFAVGWFWNIDERNRLYSYNTGNPGSFLTKVFVFKDLDRAFILLCNAQTPEADAGLDILYRELQKQYCNK
jgi:CubicO group peptidase (beta-lactamase class C family)